MKRSELSPRNGLRTRGGREQRSRLRAGARAVAACRACPAAQNRCLVLVNLQGGNDGLNCIVPHGDPQYYQLRPSLAIAHNDVLAIDAQLGFNPQMRSFKAMYDKGMVADRPGRRLPERRSLAFPLERDLADRRAGSLRAHRLARPLSRRGRACRPAISSTASRSRKCCRKCWSPTRTDVPAISNLGQYGLIADREPMARARRTRRSRAIDSLPFKSPYLAHVMEIEDHAQRRSEELPQLIAGYKTQAAYPADADRPQPRARRADRRQQSRHEGALRLSTARSTRTSARSATQDNLLEQFSDAIAAFYADLAAHGNDRRVLTMTFSEFGRRIEENGSRGTDHGEASPLFLIGGGVKGGVYGKLPDLGKHEHGQPRRSRPTSAASMRPCSSAGSAGPPKPSWAARSRSSPSSADTPALRPSTARAARAPLRMTLALRSG